MNRDGQLMLDEAAGDAVLQRSFQLTDRNSNGVVTRDEVQSFEAQQPQQDPRAANATSGQAAGASSVDGTA